MRNDSLRSVIRYLIEVSHKFDIKVLDSIGGLGDMQQYAQEHNLHFLGQGSGRRVFRLTPKRVLKLAHNEKGIAQNNAEVEIFTDPSSKPIIAKIFKVGQGYKWITSELARPIKNDAEFQRLTGVKVDDFKRFIKELKKKHGRPTLKTPVITPTQKTEPTTRVDRPRQPTKKNEPLSSEATDPTQTSPDNILNTYQGNARQFLESIASMMDSAGLLGGDLKFIDHWGKTADGRVVLLDYGFTGDVYAQHYAGLSGGHTAKPKLSYM